MAHISVIAPVFNEEGCLRELCRRLRESLEPVTPDFEIVMVDDGSRDRSWEVIGELAAADPRIKGIRFSRNFGQHYAITAGLDCCDGDWVVVMDCDLQDRPEEIPRLYAKAREGHDVVLAQRIRRRDAFLKRITSGLFYRVFNYFTGMKYDGRVGNFRIVSRPVVESFRTMREQLRFFGGIVEWLGFPTTSIPVEHAERFSGRGAYTWPRLWKLGQEVILAYSDRPLRLVIQLGFVISSLAFAYGVYVAVRALVHRVAVAGWSSLIVSVYFLAGIIISILGIIGIYLGRTFDETKKRPLYVIRERKNV
jgi:dolichol-phosphate mannosyltransferase